ncbi:MAG: hypothetical protein MK132_21335 [Lentisphaerales bacterium]|nr:hypothetical protein [Lentisphaerales bacterium]
MAQVKFTIKKINSSIFQVSKNLEQRWSPFQESQRVKYTKEELPSKGTDDPQHLIKNGPGEKDYILPLNRKPSDRYPEKNVRESHD